ncbi:MAG: hypothetical protein ACI8RD_011598 [Bacillariaceae sp.]|jgi:hypothetical protein
MQPYLTQKRRSRTTLWYPTDWNKALKYVIQESEEENKLLFLD